MPPKGDANLNKPSASANPCPPGATGEDKAADPEDVRMETSAEAAPTVKDRTKDMTNPTSWVESINADSKILLPPVSSADLTPNSQKRAAEGTAGAGGSYANVAKRPRPAHTLFAYARKEKEASITLPDVWFELKRALLDEVVSIVDKGNYNILINRVYYDEHKKRMVVQVENQEALVFVRDFLNWFTTHKAPNLTLQCFTKEEIEKAEVRKRFPHKGKVFLKREDSLEKQQFIKFFILLNGLGTEGETFIFDDCYNVRNTMDKNAKTHYGTNYRFFATTELRQRIESNGNLVFMGSGQHFVDWADAERARSVPKAVAAGGKAVAGPMPASTASAANKQTASSVTTPIQPVSIAAEMAQTVRNVNLGRPGTVGGAAAVAPSGNLLRALKDMPRINIDMLKRSNVTSIVPGTHNFPTVEEFWSFSKYGRQRYRKFFKDLNIPDPYTHQRPENVPSRRAGGSGPSSTTPR